MGAAAATLLVLQWYYFIYNFFLFFFSSFIRFERKNVMWKIWNVPTYAYACLYMRMCVHQTYSINKNTLLCSFTYEKFYQTVNHQYPLQMCVRLHMCMCVCDAHVNEKKFLLGRLSWILSLKLFGIQRKPKDKYGVKCQKNRSVSFPLSVRVNECVDQPLYTL